MTFMAQCTFALGFILGMITLEKALELYNEEKTIVCRWMNKEFIFDNKNQQMTQLEDDNLLLSLFFIGDWYC